MVVGVVDVAGTYGSAVGCISVASTEAFTGVRDGGLVEGHSAGCRSL